MNPTTIERVGAAIGITAGAVLASGDLDIHTTKPNVDVGVFHRSDVERKRKAKARKADRAAKAARKRNRRR